MSQNEETFPATSVRSNIQVIKPPVLFAKTQKLIEEIEKKIDGTLICYWHSSMGSVCQNDVFMFYEVLRRKQKEAKEKNKKLYLFIKSDGGDGKASLRIANLLRKYFDHIVALIPLECASAATMLALGADEIHMGPLSFLSAVDTSLTHALSPVDRHNNLVSVSQDELTRVVKLWNQERKDSDSNPYQALYPSIHPLVFGAVDRASSLSIRLCQEILSFHMKDQKRAEQISQKLNADYPSHSYPITLSEAVKIGLSAKPLDANLNTLLLELNKLYSEMGQRALTDYDELNYHDNEIYNIIEGTDLQIYYQVDKDWHYRSEERRWVPLNDNSSWRMNEKIGSKTKYQVLHIR